MKSGKFIFMILAFFVLTLAFFFTRNGTGQVATHPAQRLGFNIDFSLIPPDDIHHGGPPKDGIPALTNPDVIPASQAEYLTPDDLVIGVTTEKLSRAYPLRVLNYHEIVNDSLGAVPFMVTYCPLCRSALVFDRRTGGKVVEFGVSGLLWNSNVLLYDRVQPESRQSLWSQVRMAAVTGPAARQGLKLTLLPSSLTTWEQWHNEHPLTTVLSPQTAYPRNYNRSPYANYFRSDRLMFPVRQNNPRPDGYANKEMMVLIETAEANKAYAIRDIARTAGDKGWLRDKVGNVEIRFDYNRPGNTVKVSAADPNALHLMKAVENGNNTGKNEKPRLAVAWLYWFALDAIRPEVERFMPETAEAARTRND